MKPCKEFIYYLASQDLVTHIDCWEKRDWEKADKKWDELMKATKKGEQ